MPEARKRRRFTRDERTAYHEAGHALAGYLLGRRFFHVSALPELLRDEHESYTHGHVMFVPWELDVSDEFGSRAPVQLEDEFDGHKVSRGEYWVLFHPDFRHKPFTEASPDVAEREVIKTMAGMVAWEIHTRRYATSGDWFLDGTGDIQNYTEWLEVLHPEGWTRREEQGYRKKARTLLKQPAHRAALDALAHALIERGFIVYSDAVAIMRAAIDAEGEGDGTR